MRHTNPNVTTIKKMIVITNLEVQMVAEIMALKGSLSFSQIVREAIFDYHRSLKPPYLKPTINQEEKIEKKKKEVALRAIPDREYAEKNLSDIMFYTDEDQVEWILFRKISNYVGAVQLSKVKDWINSKDPEFVYHSSIADASTHPAYEEELKDEPIRKVLQEQYGVAITV